MVAISTSLSQLWCPRILIRRPSMRAHQVMTRQVIAVGVDATMVEAVDTMLRHHISRLTVAGKLIGIISEGDFICRAEVGTQRERRRRLALNQYRRLFYLSVALTLLGSATAAFAQNLENGRRLSERWCSQCHAIGSGSGQIRSRAIICIDRGQGQNHHRDDRLVPAPAARHHAERAAEPQRRPGYRRVHHGHEKVAYR